jgi:hypothetical protein
MVYDAISIKISSVSGFLATLKKFGLTPGNVVFIVAGGTNIFCEAKSNIKYILSNGHVWSK